MSLEAPKAGSGIRCARVNGTETLNVIRFERRTLAPFDACGAFLRLFPSETLDTLDASALYKRRELYQGRRKTVCWPAAPARSDPHLLAKSGARKPRAGGGDCRRALRAGPGSPRRAPLPFPTPRAAFMALLPRVSAAEAWPSPTTVFNVKVWEA